jgi:hypothetical protein
LDSSLFTFDSNDLTINTSNNLKKKTYNLKATAIQTTYLVSQTILFYVKVIDTCDGVVLTKVTLISPQSYDIQTGSAVSLGSTSWSKDISYCPSITYEIIDTATSTTADSIFYFSGG